MNRLIFRELGPDWLRLLCFVLAAILLLSSASLSLAHEPPLLPPLSAPPGSPRLPGKLLWADLVTTNVTAVRTFYAGLLGWTFEEIGSHLIAFQQNQPVAGLIQLNGQESESEVRPRWIGYLSVSHIDQVRHRVAKEGGRVLIDPGRLPERGEQAVFADPEGAVFGVIRSDHGDPPDYLPEPGEWIWMQLLSQDPRGAGKFYRKIAGYKVKERAEKDGRITCFLSSQGYARAAVTGLHSGATVKPNWLPFVRVRHLTESLSRTTALGGKVLLKPRPELFRGHVAVVADPTGAALGLLDWESEPKLEVP